jgi:hypothetical protein
MVLARTIIVSIRISLWSEVSGSVFFPAPMTVPKCQKNLAGRRSSRERFVVN